MGASFRRRVLCLLVGTALIAPGPASSQAIGPAAAEAACTAPPAPFAGKIGRTMAASVEHWPGRVSPPEGAPNVLIWLMDDVGFGLSRTFGGLVDTPNLDRLASNGLKYNNFHATPLCSPSRAALLTGRNAHAVHMGAHASTPMGFPGYDAHVPKSAATTAKVLSQHGYATSAIGKWDHVAVQDLKPTGPYDYWPSGQGFEHFYGFLAYESDHFRPTLWRDHQLVGTPEAVPQYYLTADLADEAIRFVNSLEATDPERPFYIYWATGAVHSPHQATQPWLDRYKGRFDHGWDAYREETLRSQKAMGLVPPTAQLAPRPSELPAWSSLSPPQKALYARQMEAIAAQLSEADHAFGRILDNLQRTGQLDDTLVIVTSDNGASAEGGPDGTFNMAANSSGIAPSVAENIKHQQAWGGPEVLGHYSAGWAVAANTPFRYFKQAAHEGGQHVPMVVSWPKGIKSRGVRSQYGHLIDLSPTILAAARITPPACVEGVRQQPIDGVALNATFDDPRAPDLRKTQYYELWGNRGVYHDGWKAVVLHKPRAWDILGTVPFEQDRWELYDLRKDPGETRDLAAAEPAKLAQMKALFDEEARRFNVYPIDDNLARGVKAAQRTHGGRTEFDYPVPGAVGIHERAMPPINGRSYDIKVRLDAGERPQGVLVAAGGVEAGFSLFVKDGRLHYEYNDLGLARWALTDPAPLPKGKVTAVFRYRLDGPMKGVGTLVVNGREVASAPMTQRVRAGYSGGGELFNIGLDMGSAPTSAYAPPYAFSGGTIEGVKVSLAPAPTASTK